MCSVLNKLSCRLVDAVQDHVRRWLKPSTHSLAGGATVDLTRSKADLIAENALLRQQLIILQRQSKRPQLNNFDRVKLLLLARSTPYWKQALLIVQPDTLLRWHRELFRIIWRRKSKPKSLSPRIPAETIALIRHMATDNLTWGAERIRGELLKLGIKVSKRMNSIDTRPTNRNRMPVSVSTLPLSTSCRSVCALSRAKPTPTLDSARLRNASGAAGRLRRKQA